MIKQLEGGGVVEVVELPVDEVALDKSITNMQTIIAEQSIMQLKDKPDEETLAYWNNAVMENMNRVACIAESVSILQQKKESIQAAKVSPIEPILIEEVIK